MSSHAHSKPVTGERLLTCDEVATYLRVPLATIYAWRYRGEGPQGFRVGRYLRFRQTDVEAWVNGLMSGRQQS